MTTPTPRNPAALILGTLIGILRLLVSLPFVVISSVLVVIASLLPIRIRGIGLANWMVGAFSQMLLWIFGVHMSCPDQARLLLHEGFVFANHSSYADVFLFVAIRPMRFLAAREYLDWPFFGWAAKATGVIGVDRSSTRSRAQSLLSLAKLEYNPPIGLFPEGGIGPLYELQPFYHGVFKLCVEHQIPYALCAIIYDRVDVIGWRDESVVVALWRLATHISPQRAQLHLLYHSTPAPDASPRQLAIEAHRTVANALGYAAKM